MRTARFASPRRTSSRVTRSKRGAIRRGRSRAASRRGGIPDLAIVAGVRRSLVRCRLWRLGDPSAGPSGYRSRGHGRITSLARAPWTAKRPGCRRVGCHTLDRRHRRSRGCRRSRAERRRRARSPARPRRSSHRLSPTGWEPGPTAPRLVARAAGRSSGRLARRAERPSHKQGQEARCRLGRQPSAEANERGGVGPADASRGDDATEVRSAVRTAPVEANGVSPTPPPVAGVGRPREYARGHPRSTASIRTTTLAQGGLVDPAHVLGRSLRDPPTLRMHRRCPAPASHRARWPSYLTGPRSSPCVQSRVPRSPTCRSATASTSRQTTRSKPNPGVHHPEGPQRRAW